MKKTVVGIFEPDESSRFIFREILNREKNLEVHIFSDPVEGLAMADHLRFDIVFIEIHFWKDFGGLDILQKLKEAMRKDPIAVGMISLLQKGDLERVIGSGFTMCVDKSTSLHPVFHLIDGHLN